MSLIKIFAITAFLANPSAALYKHRNSITLQQHISSVDCCPYQNIGKGSCLDGDGDLPAYYYEVQGYTQSTCQKICDQDDLCTGYSMRELMPGRLPGCYIFAGGRFGLPVDEIPQVKAWAFQLGTGTLLPVARIANNSQYTCMRKQIGTCTLVENLHINAFDGGQVPLLLSRNGSDPKSGDKWLVKSRDVSIQARLGENGMQYKQETLVRTIAVGGSFLKGNVLIIGALEHHITWNGAAVLENHSASFEVDHGDFFVKAKHTKRSLLVEDLSKQSIGVNVALPLGVKLIVGRSRDRINVVIKMPPQDEGQSGICGSFNRVAADESRDVVVQRSDSSVAAEESLFREQHNFRRIQLVQESMLRRS